jgi:coenzyme Q-binding protein COQ10
MGKIVQSIDIDAPIEVAFATIADFNSYTKFVDGMRAAKILERDDDHMQVKFTLDLFKRITYTLDVKLKQPTQISWKLHEADMIKRNDGGWKLKRLSDGRTLAEYSIDIDFKIWVPGPVAKFLVSTSIPSTLTCFKGEIEKRAARITK